MKIALLSALLVTVAVGCNDPNKDKPKAVTGEAVATAGAQANAAPANATTYSFDNTNSKVGFVGAKAIGQHDGGFNAFKGTARVPGTDIEKGTVNVDIDTTSVFTDTEKLTTHLKGADFFDTEKFPKAKFESTSVKKGGDNGATHTVTGNLTMHGVTKSITFPAKIAVTGDALTLNAEFNINRKDFNINYAGQADNLIKDNVLMKLDIKAKKG